MKFGGVWMFLISRKESDGVPVNGAKNYNGVDLMKFICAIMVFTLHIPPFHGEALPELAKYVNFGLQQFVCRVAVPFYFVSSGFFLFRKMPLYKPDKEIIKMYCFKILRLLGIWNVLLCVGGTFHLWYLGATVIAIILLGYCLHLRIRLSYIYAIAGALYVIGLLGDSYYGVIAPLENLPIIGFLLKGYKFAFTTTRNGVFMGFIFVLMGATFAGCRIAVKARTALMGFAASMLCLFFEVFVLQYHDIPTDHNMYIFLLPATFFLFSFAASFELKDRPVYKHLRKIGMLIYFTHILVEQFVSLAITLFDKYWGIALGHYRYVLSLPATFLIALIIDWLSCKDRFKWVNWIIS
jgi:serine/alanine racemase